MALSVKHKLTYLNCKFDIVHVNGIMLSKFSLRRKKKSKYEQCTGLNTVQ